MGNRKVIHISTAGDFRIFEWKHGVSFQTTKSVFFDEYAVQFYDEENSSEEERFIMLGMSNLSRILVVCHCELSEDEVIRIISARKATKREQGFYPYGVL